MPVKEIMEQVEALDPDERNQIAAFLVHLRHKKDPHYYQKISDRLDDERDGRWVSLEEFEKKPDLEENPGQ